MGSVPFTVSIVYCMLLALGWLAQRSACQLCCTNTVSSYCGVFVVVLEKRKHNAADKQLCVWWFVNASGSSWLSEMGAVDAQSRGPVCGRLCWLPQLPLEATATVLRGPNGESIHYST